MLPDDTLAASESQLEESRKGSPTVATPPAIGNGTTGVSPQNQMVPEKHNEPVASPTSPVPSLPSSSASKANDEVLYNNLEFIWIYYLTYF